MIRFDTKYDSVLTLYCHDLRFIIMVSIELVLWPLRTAEEPFP